MKMKLNYRLHCRFESHPPTEIEMPNLQAAIQEGWKKAAKPQTTAVTILSDARGKFLPHSVIK